MAIIWLVEARRFRGSYGDMMGGGRDIAADERAVGEGLTFRRAAFMRSEAESPTLVFVPCCGGLKCVSPVSSEMPAMREPGL